jgi:RES domain-containing protein
MLEMLVQDEPLRARYIVIPVTLPDGMAIERVDTAKLPSDWRTFRRVEHLRTIGADWAASRRTVVLAVPSAVLAEETNYLLNPLHPEFKRLQIGKGRTLVTDVRLLRRA